MDKSKYLIPKYSETLEPLIIFLKDNIVMINDSLPILGAR